jgi:hypothetical protein
MAPAEKHLAPGESLGAFYLRPIHGKIPGDSIIPGGCEPPAKCANQPITSPYSLNPTL